MRITVSFGLLLCLAASPVGASPKITKSYKYYDGLMADQDAACSAALVEHIAVDYDGLEKIEIGGNSLFSTANGYLATFAGAKFHGRYGDATGTVNCIFSADGRILTDISVTFDGRGLAGYKGKAAFGGDQDLSQSRKTALSKTLVP